MRLPGDAVFAFGALLMAWDFIVKLRPPRIPSNSANSLPSANGRLGA
jgi:hypothetical protein